MVLRLKWGGEAISVNYDLWFLQLFTKKISFDLCCKEQTILVLQCKESLDFY